MEQQIKSRFSDTILQEAMQRYGIAEGNITRLDGFESFIYAYTKEDRPFILRIGHSRRRSAALIHGEVDWINYLAAGGAGAASAIFSERGELVERLDDGREGQFLATAFRRAPGGPPVQGSFYDVAFLRRYGRLIGQTHTLSKQYQLPNPAWQRPQWDDPIMLDSVDFLPDSAAIVRQKTERHLAYLRQLPKDESSYGLIHQDAHAGNFFVDEVGTMTLFDFDDCVYSWFANDIAIVLFYAIANRDHADEYAPFFLRHFLEGYRQENEFDNVWLEEIPHFMKERELELYAIIHRSFDVENINDSWASQFIHGRQARLENDTPFVNVDWQKFR